MQDHNKLRSAILMLFTLSIALFFQGCKEEKLEVEEWMLDLDYFYNTDTYEEAIELEPWMLDTEYFISDETNEDPIELEDWMIF